MRCKLAILHIKYQLCPYRELRKKYSYLKSEGSFKWQIQNPHWCFSHGRIIDTMFGHNVNFGSIQGTCKKNKDCKQTAEKCKYISFSPSNINRAFKINKTIVPAKICLNLVLEKDLCIFGSL